jgi:hypothetical protein
MSHSSFGAIDLTGGTNQSELLAEDDDRSNNDDNSADTAATAATAATAGIIDPLQCPAKKHPFFLALCHNHAEARTPFARTKSADGRSTICSCQVCQSSCNAVYYRSQADEVARIEVAKKEQRKVRKLILWERLC